MKITLITASFNDLVHGTYNDKKTGCGINLMKPETASRYSRGGEMSYLGEITCEKCKAKIAKEMIKADSKEMKALLKEEKLRAKRGIEDEGLVQLSELGTRPTSVAPPEPEPPVQETPSVPVDSVQVNASNPAYSDDLAQFAIKKPQEVTAPEPVAEKPEDDFLAQFAIKKPQETAPEPVAEESEDDFLAQFAIKKPQETAPEPVAEEPEDDFLAQFAINKPQETAPEPVAEEPEDDFLAQFAINKPQETSYEEEPSAPPVIDDISEALNAMQNSSLASFRKEPEPTEEAENDILSMFAIDKSEQTDNTVSANSYISSGLMDDDEDESIFDAMNSDDDSDSDSTNEWDIIANQLFGDISEESTKSPVIEDIAVPEIEDVKPPVIEEITVPEIEDVKPPVIEEITVPEIEDVKPPVIEEITVPEIEDIKPPVIEEIPVPEIEDIKPPVIEDIPAPAPVETVKPEPKPAPVAPPPVQQAPKPVIPPVQPAPQNFTPPPVQQPIMPPPVAPVQPMNAPTGMGMGQIVTVPQITGYDQNGQPVYAYMQMILQGYDQNGQPIMMPMPMGMGMPMPVQMPVPPVQQAPQQPEYSSLSKNSRLQAVLDSLDEPVSEKEMTIGQKIAAAAKDSPVTANVSKIATNPHSRSTSQAFINAISDSKDDTQSLTESQGLKPKTMILDSIEDVLSQLGDNSLKEKKEKEAKLQNNIPVYEEFKNPARTSSSSFSRPVPSSSRTSSSDMMDVPLTKAQQKELKKQQKIDAKFQKEMAKRNK